MSQEGMDRWWRNATRADRLKTIRQEIMVGHFDAARMWLTRYGGVGVIDEIRSALDGAVRHQARAVALLLTAEEGRR